MGRPTPKHTMDRIGKLYDSLVHAKEIRLIKFNCRYNKEKYTQCVNLEDSGINACDCKLISTANSYDLIIKYDIIKFVILNEIRKFQTNNNYYTIIKKK